MADQSAEARLLGPSSSPEEVLTFLTRLLGKGVFKNDDEKASHAAAAQERATRLWSAIPWENSVGSTSEGSKREEDEVADPDFSSFPSLSLERSPREQLEGDLNRRASIEAHVSSLLSRPILVSNSATKSTLSEENENESDALEFIAEKSEEVPNLMLQNFFTSFSTLLNSRLRAYATFLARHGLSLFECSETAEELEDGVTGVEQKLETMLEIGRLVSADAVVTSFQAKPEEAKVINDEEQVDEQKVSVPLVMEASINISIPRPVGDGSESITVSFRANGNITGVFVKSALRVVQVDLEMSQLLPSMIRQASRVISRIVEMTNAAYSLALPNYEDAQAEAIRHNLPASPANQKGNVHPEDHPEQGSSLHIISPSLKPVKESTSTTDSDPPVVPDLTLGDESTLSTEKCEHLVDYIFGEINDSFMRPPSSKKAKFSSGVDALPVGS